MSSPQQSHASPVVTGAVTAVISLATALGVVVVPALAAQLAATRSTATVLDAILIALNALVLGHGGGIILSVGVIDGAMTLTPMGLQIIFLLIMGLGMRRTGRSLDLIADDGGLRPRGLRDAGSALAASTLVYAVGLGLMAELGRSELMDPVMSSAVVSGALVALLGGLGGLAASVRRSERHGLPPVRILDLLPRPWDAVVRSALVALLGLLALGMLGVVLMVVVGFREVGALHAQLDPGIVGGLVLTLVQLALLPLFAVWGTVILLGGTVSLGTGTMLGLGGFQTGVMPALPLLGALPDPGTAPMALRLLMILPALAVGLGAVRLVRDVADLDRRDQVTAWIGYPMVVLVAVLLLTGLSGGAIGDGRLAHVGPQARDVLLPLTLLVLLVTAVVITLLATPLVARVRSAVDSVRDRVETAEASERGEETPEPFGPPSPDQDDEAREDPEGDSGRQA